MSAPVGQGRFRVRLDDVARIITGRTPSPAVPEYWNGELPFVTPGDLNESIFRGNAARTLSEEGRARCRLISGHSSLVTCIGSSVGKVAFTLTPCTTNQQINAVTARKGTDPFCLHYAIENSAERIRALAGNTAVPLVTKGQLAKLSLVLPPNSLQRTIGGILFSCDASAAALAKLRAAKRAFRRALMQDLLTGRRRLGRAAASGKFQNSAFGSTPVGWDIVPLSAVATRLTRRNAENHAMVLTCSGEQGLIDQTEFFSKTVAGESREGYFLLHQGDFAYNRSTMLGYPFGAIKRLDKYEKGVVSTLNICFSLQGSKISSDFALQLFESGLINRQLGRIARVGSRAHGLLNVTTDDFLSVMIPLPAMGEQVRIATLLNGLHTEVQQLEALGQQMMMLKRGLMQRLLSGDLDLPDALAASAAATTPDAGGNDDDS